MGRWLQPAIALGSPVVPSYSYDRSVLVPGFGRAQSSVWPSVTPDAIVSCIAAPRRHNLNADVVLQMTAADDALIVVYADELAPSKQKYRLSCIETVVKHEFS